MASSLCCNEADTLIKNIAESDSFPCLSPKDEARAKEYYELICKDSISTGRCFGGSGMRSYSYYKDANGIIYVISDYCGNNIEWKRLDDGAWYLLR